MNPISFLKFRKLAAYNGIHLPTTKLGTTMYHQCTLCKKEFKRDSNGKKKSKRYYCSQQCVVEHRKLENIVNQNILNCNNCKQDFSRKKSACREQKFYFCKRSCQLEFSKTTNITGRISKILPATYNCKICKSNYILSYNHKMGEHQSKQYCSDCMESDSFEELKIIAYKSLTLAVYYLKLSVVGKHPSWRSSHIRFFNRSWNANLSSYPCQYCNYSNHIEFCHIKPVSSYSDDTTLGEVNHPDNILILCPNHHWEFDNGLLLLKDIPPRIPNQPIIKPPRKIAIRESKIQWPSNNELAKLLLETPSSHLAKALGVSDVAITKHCKKNNIAKPPRGYWAKLAAKEFNQS